jgi:hypothetical protein
MDKIRQITEDMEDAEEEHNCAIQKEIHNILNEQTKMNGASIEVKYEILISRVKAIVNV